MEHKPRKTTGVDCKSGRRVRMCRHDPSNKRAFIPKPHDDEISISKLWLSVSNALLISSRISAVIFFSSTTPKILKLDCISCRIYLDSRKVEFPLVLSSFWISQVINLLVVLPTCVVLIQWKDIIN